MLFDTHLHLIYKKNLTYPWLSDFAALDSDNTLATYKNAAQKLGITGCLHMEVDVSEGEIGTEIDFVTALAQEDSQFLRGVIGSCRPEQSGFESFLDQAQENGLLRGFRRVLHVVPDDISTTQTFRDNIKRLSGTGLTFDLCVLPKQLPLAAELVDHCPDVTFVLDHCGVPDIAGGELESWSGNIKALAERPNVVAKISGIVAYATPDVWGLEDLRPFVDETVAAFGSDRLIWGSDSPVCNLGGGLPTWVAATHALTKDWAPHERDALFHANAYKLWKL